MEALPFKVWQNIITAMIQTADYKWTGVIDVLHRIRAKLAYFEGELPRLYEATTILELAIWKMQMNKKNCQDIATQSQKKIKTDKSSTRQQCREHVVLMLSLDMCYRRLSDRSQIT